MCVRVSQSSGSWFSLFVFPLICIFFLGLKELGNGLSDPFGCDDCDFNQEALANGAHLSDAARESTHAWPLTGRTDMEDEWNGQKGNS